MCKANIKITFLSAREAGSDFLFFGVFFALMRLVYVTHHVYVDVSSDVDSI